MEQAAVSPRIYRFGEFELCVDTAELRKNGVRIKLQGQPFQILVMLLQLRGEVVTRDAIRAALWPADTFVDFEHSLNTAVKKLRHALGDAAENARFIETLPRLGYRFVAAANDVAPVIETALPTPVAPRRRSHVVLVVATLAVTLAIAAFVLRDWLRSPGLRITATTQLTFNGNPTTFETDGKRVYYFKESDSRLYSVPVAGGEETSSPTKFSDPQILHISPDGATLLVKESVGPSVGYSNRLWLVPTDGTPARPLGDIQADLAGAWSPDGKTLAFAQGNTIYGTADQGATYHRLLDAPGMVGWIRWSPDGRRLRFTVPDLRTDVPSIWEAPATVGAHSTQIRWDAPGDGCCGIWTRDGQHYLFSRRRNQRLDYWIVDERWSPFRSRKLVPLGGGGPELIAAIASPTDSRIFVIGAQTSNASFKFDPVHRQLTPLMPDQSVEAPDFSPDGKWMTYVVQHSEQEIVWRSRSDGTDAAPLTDPKLSAAFPHFSRDGKHVAFMGRRPEQTWKVFWMSADGGALHELDPSIVSQADANWMPDNQSILFGQTPWYLADPNSPRALYVQNVQTGLLSKVPGSDGWFSPRLSPDGRSFLALSVDEQKLALYEFATSQWRVVVNRPDDRIGAPFWSADGKWAYLNLHSKNDSFSRNGSLIRIRLRDGSQEKALTFKEWVANPSCNAWGMGPDGSIVIACWRPETNIYALQYE